ncbi:MAG: hypothetical protein AAB368_12340, partial [bacterium]
MSYTNGTVLLEINGANYSANLYGGKYNVSLTLTNNSYSYKWYAYGNGTQNNLNVSATRNYVVNSLTYPAISVTVPANNSYVNSSSVTINLTLSEAGSCLYNLNNGINISMN